MPPQLIKLLEILNGLKLQSWTKSLVGQQNERKAQQIVFWHFSSLNENMHDQFLQDIRWEKNCMPLSIFLSCITVLQCQIENVSQNLLVD